MYGAVDGVRGHPLHAPRPQSSRSAPLVRPSRSAASSFRCLIRFRLFRSRLALILENSGYSVAKGQPRQPFVGQLPHALPLTLSPTPNMGQSSHSLDGQLLHRSMEFVEMSCDWPPPSAYKKPSLPTKRDLKLYAVITSARSFSNLTNSSQGTKWMH